MTEAELHAAVKALFLDVLELEPAEREAQLAAAPPEVAAATRALLTRDAQGATPFETPLADTAALASSPAPDLERIGPFTILERLGAGGMGVVYEAIEDGTGRHVALKLLAPGLVAWSGPKVKQRFQREIIALGRLEHPGIARILSHGDLSEAEGARPWFAMELVRGRDLSTYVTEQRPSLDARLRLFHAIADAVAHAHERGIAHRDLKPQNILVTDAGIPKVLDFGIARMFEDDGATRLTLERTAAFIGTLAYLPPERLDSHGPLSLVADGRRGDVYALGCVFWEALFGRLPLPLEGTPLAAALEILRTEEVPSARRLRLLTDPDTRGGHPPRDVAVILEVSLAREPTRRYADAGALASDLERYLDSRPIHARPPTTLYRTLKFTRRHRLLVAATLIVFASLVVGIFTTRHQAHLARTAERRATAVRDFLLNDMLRGANPWRAGQVTVEDLLRQAQANMDAAFAGDPETLELMRAVLGETWAGLGRNDQARPLLLEALTTARELGGNELANSLQALAQLDLDAQRPDLAAAFVYELKSLAPDSPRTLLLAGRLASQRGAFEEARDCFQTALAGTSDRGTSLFASIAENELRWGNYPKALAAITACLEATEAELGPMDPMLATRLATRARIELDTDQTDAAGQDLARARQILTEHLGPDHAALLPIRILETQLALFSGQLDDSAALAVALEDNLPSAAEAPLLRARLLSLRGTMRLFKDETDAALADSNEALHLTEEVTGNQHPLFASCLLARAPIFEWRGELDSAILDLERAVSIFAEHVSPMQAEFAETELTLGSFLQRAGRADESLAHLEHAVRLFNTIHGENGPTTLFAKHELAIALVGVDALAKARAIIVELIATQSQLSGPRSEVVAANLQTLAMIAAKSGDLEAAARDYTSAAELFTELSTRRDPNLGRLYRNLAKIQLDLGRFDEALAAAKNYAEIMTQIFGPDSELAQAARSSIDSIQARRQAHAEL